jgi:hypothetical protein
MSYNQIHPYKLFRDFKELQRLKQIFYQTALIFFKVLYQTFKWIYYFFRSIYKELPY